MAYAFSWGGALFDLTIVVWLMWKRTRAMAYVALVVFHLMTYLLFPEIGVFQWLMMGAALLFFSPDWPRQLIGWLTEMRAPHVGEWCPAQAPEDRQENRLSAVVMVAVAAFVSPNSWCRCATTRTLGM